jgi:hypothetical protein
MFVVVLSDEILKPFPVCPDTNIVMRIGLGYEYEGWYISMIVAEVPPAAVSAQTGKIRTRWVRNDELATSLSMLPNYNPMYLRDLIFEAGSQRAHRLQEYERCAACLGEVHCWT